jgi:hypothetical protein
MNDTPFLYSKKNKRREKNATMHVVNLLIFLLPAGRLSAAISALCEAGPLYYYRRSRLRTSSHCGVAVAEPALLLQLASRPHRRYLFLFFSKRKKK